MIDLHCHILPGIDDGADDLEQALNMARKAQKDGVKAIIATPHFIHGSVEHNTRENVIRCTQAFNDILLANDIELTIFPGSEVFITPELPQLIQAGQIMALNDTRYVLIELPMDALPSYIEPILYELQLLGKIPIIAHPERNRLIIKNPNILLPYLEKGTLLQVNTGSCAGIFGEDVERTAWRLLTDGFAAFISSDAHSEKTRGPILSRIYKQVEERLGNEKAQVLFVQNAESVINDQEILFNMPQVCITGKRNIFNIFSHFISKWSVRA